MIWGKGPNSFFCMWIQLFIPIVEEAILSPLNDHGTLVKNQLTICVWFYFWTLNLFHWSICLSLCHCHTVLITVIHNIFRQPIQPSDILTYLLENSSSPCVEIYLVLLLTSDPSSALWSLIIINSNMIRKLVKVSLFFKNILGVLLLLFITLCPQIV